MSRSPTCRSVAPRVLWSSIRRAVRVVVPEVPRLVRPDELTASPACCGPKRDRLGFESASRLMLCAIAALTCGPALGFVLPVVLGAVAARCYVRASRLGADALGSRHRTLTTSHVEGRARRCLSTGPPRGFPRAPASVCGAAHARDSNSADACRHAGAPCAAEINRSATSEPPWCPCFSMSPKEGSADRRTRTCYLWFWRPVLYLLS